MSHQPPWSRRNTYALPLSVPHRGHPDSTPRQRRCARHCHSEAKIIIASNWVGLANVVTHAPSRLRLKHIRTPLQLPRYLPNGLNDDPVCLDTPRWTKKSNATKADWPRVATSEPSRRVETHYARPIGRTSVRSR